MPPGIRTIVEYALFNYQMLVHENSLGRGMSKRRSIKREIELGNIPQHLCWIENPAGES